MAAKDDSAVALSRQTALVENHERRDEDDRENYPWCHDSGSAANS
jgi:hypothetical protein